MHVETDPRMCVTRQGRRCVVLADLLIRVATEIENVRELCATMLIGSFYFI